MGSEELGGLMLAMGFQFGKTGVMGSLVGVSSGLGGPIMFSSKMVGKRCSVNNKTNVIEGGGKGKAFGKDRRLMEVVRGEVDGRVRMMDGICGIGVVRCLKFVRKIWCGGR